MISTALIWLGVVLAGAGLYLAYRNQQTQIADRAQATAVAAALEPATEWTEEAIVQAPTPTATATATPEVFPVGWSTATPVRYGAANRRSVAKRTSAATAIR